MGSELILKARALHYHQLNVEVVGPLREDLNEARSCELTKERRSRNTQQPSSSGVVHFTARLLLQTKHFNRAVCQP